MKEAKQKSILVVEDERAIARALTLKLEKAGFLVQLASDGEQALKMISENHFHLILLDIVLPKKDGYAVLAELKQKQNKIPIVVSSNLSQKEDILKAKNLGAKDFFVKSTVSISEVVQIINKYI